MQKITPIHSAKGFRVGPVMHAAVRFVAKHGPCSIRPIAAAVGPHGSLCYGYRAVHRAISAGLLVATRAKSGVYTVSVPVNLQPGQSKEGHDPKLLD